jgi:tRNA-Thr(GGU) m(6)t(6)A37 methyltransferase TsaA
MFKICPGMNMPHITIRRNDYMEPIAYIKTDFPEKFGIPRQSGLVKELTAKIYFKPEYRNPDAFKGLSGYNYIWLLWAFENPGRTGWSATVKPPRLGGNTPMGVFATRSPFRPNPIGLSSVHLERIDFTEEGPVLTVSGADLRDGTPIYDIKPYLRYTDSHPDAVDGFAAGGMDHALTVSFPQELLELFPEEKRPAILEVLRQDPRPSYQNDPNRRYGVSFAGYDVHFYVDGTHLQVTDVVSL